MKKNKYYPFITWGATLFFAPLLFPLMGRLHNDPWRGADMALIPVYWLFSLVLSLPVLLIYCVFYYQLRKVIASTIALKLVLMAIGIAGVLIMCYSVGGLMDFVFISSYVLAVIAVSFIVPIEAKNEDLPS